MPKILNFVEEIKEDMRNKKELENRRLNILKKEEGALSFFDKEKQSPTYSVNTIQQTKHLQEGAAQLSETIKILIDIDKDIRNIDNAIIMKFESLCSDFVLKFEIPYRIDLTGDVTHKETAVLTPFRTNNPEYKEIVPEDLKFILFIKDQFNVRNFNSIELINKEDYYNSNGGIQL
jgi:hypothetical protein